MTAVEVVAAALRAQTRARVPFGQHRTDTLAQIAVQALVEAGYDLERQQKG